MSLPAVTGMKRKVITGTTRPVITMNAG